MEEKIHILFYNHSSKKLIELDIKPAIRHYINLLHIDYLDSFNHEDIKISGESFQILYFDGPIEEARKLPITVLKDGMPFIRGSFIIGRCNDDGNLSSLSKDDVALIEKQYGFIFWKCPQSKKDFYSYGIKVDGVQESIYIKNSKDKNNRVLLN